MMKQQNKRRNRRTNRILSEPEQHASITALSHDGRGIAHINDKTTFLWGGLEGEKVLFRYKKKLSHFDEGEVSQVLTAAATRTTPRCQHFGMCGGCSVQYMEHSAQVIYKEKTVLDLLHHQANIQNFQLFPPIISHPWGYRRKARLSVKYVVKKDKVVVGFCERQSHMVTDLNHCDTLHPHVGTHIKDFSDLFFSLEIRQHIPQLDIAVGDNATAIVIRHLKNFSDSDLAQIEQFAKLHEFHIYLQPGKLDSVKLFYPNDAALPYYTLPDYDLKIHFHPLHFIQVNAEINKKMVHQALTWLDLQPEDRVLDLFGGIGNFSLPAAKQAQYVVGVEGDELATQQAQKNALSNQIQNCSFHTSNLFIAPFTEQWAGQTYDKIIIDPPRCGADIICESIQQWQAKKIVYVSCHPATLVRDAKILQEQGYELQRVGIIDMFPHTLHVEGMALFVKKS